MIVQSTTYNKMVLMVSSSDHVSGAPGLALTVELSKDGGVFVSITPTITDRGNGWYNIQLSSTDTNTLGDIALHITATGADPTDTIDQIINPVWTTSELSQIRQALGVTGSTVATSGTGNLDVVESRVDVATSTRLASSSYVAPPTSLDIENAVWNATTTSHVNVDTFGLSVSQTKANSELIMINETTLLSLLNTVLKYERNRTKIDTVAATLTVYDDDCTTPLTVFNLRDHLGNPSVAEVCDRSPQGCG